MAKAAGVSKFIVPTRGLVDGMVRTMITQPQERASTSERTVDPPIDACFNESSDESWQEFDDEQE
ncbi:MAG: hypothetical protein BWY72_01372 [Bacteroidetes bacterium ADurb.Bin416]|nr:MAG: hypothetical protein BWY72_01372 [Bacteroidetes bacterium ADurb.Bin416]